MRNLVHDRGSRLIIDGLLFSSYFSGCTMLFFQNYNPTFFNMFIFVSACITVWSVILFFLRLPKTVFHADNNKAEKVGEEQEYTPISLPRKWPKHEDIMRHKGLYILTGESGAGKTWLLRSLFFPNSIDDYRKISTDSCSYVNKNYFCGEWNSRKKLEKFENKRYLIFDQFERALASSDSNALIIIVVKKEYLGDVLNKFKEQIEADKIAWLELNNDEQSVLETVLAGRGIKNYSSVFEYLISNIKNNSISFEQISLIDRFSIEEPAIEDGDSVVFNLDLLIERYIRNYIDNLSNPSLAYMILYLLSLDSKGAYICGLSDCQNISFQSESAINTTIKLLKEKKLITEIKSYGGRGNKSEDEFEIAHDYLQELFGKVCREALSSEIRNNIEYYHNNIQKNRNSTASKNQTVTADRNSMKAIQDTYHVFRKNCERWTTTDWVLTAMMLGFLGINFLLACYFSKAAILSPQIVCFFDIHSCLSLYNNNPLYSYCTLFFVNIVMCLSMLYVYNYYCRILRILKIKPVILLVIAGVFLCFAAYVFIRFWAVWLGIEILLFGCITWIISTRVRRDEKEHFIKLATSTFVSGSITVILGILFPIYTGYSDFLFMNFFPISIPFFMLYGSFMYFCIRNHIINNNDLMILGKMLFNAEKEI